MLARGRRLRRGDVMTCTLKVRHSGTREQNPCWLRMLDGKAVGSSPLPSCPAPSHPRDPQGKVTPWMAVQFPLAQRLLLAPSSLCQCLLVGSSSGTGQGAAKPWYKAPGHSSGNQRPVWRGAGRLMTSCLSEGVTCSVFLLTAQPCPSSSQDTTHLPTPLVSVTALRSSH